MAKNHDIQYLAGILWIQKKSWIKSPNSGWNQNDRHVICANVIFSIQYVDECWSLEHHYNILYHHSNTL